MKFSVGAFWVLLALVCSAQSSAAKIPISKRFATATLEPRSGSKANGTVEFSTRGNQLLMKITLKDVTPGAHGFHVHEKGDCSALDASSAGEHFNPKGTKHGGPESKERHLGDFGNIDVMNDGTARTVVVLSSSPDQWNEFRGKSIVLHQGRDDLSSQPAGNSGDRIACGVIQ